ncbi:hydrogenase maturation nickel metallochaperone HypA [cf. Phormidesmis sp. LEGE 11477]|uniref:hydrogenase maturation nickel metallochaperone HypA n=1 Tax=cf. Phormidesmis sp. LEGE 11477 TaxID=1828680 RepID=UPI001880A354|nr:hydrogenase maturation nickel metallochaperone HypA [cf. Phormidesmis sp. LEGE 11477]MBE9059699.1 hydrogenase maturation nickel metallochaperone HypA [cf. Phormidesmis sp. LEGE 11477]
MHETDMTKALILTVKDWLSEQSGHPVVERIHLTVGQFTCVEPASLQFAFRAQVQGTFLEKSDLVIEETPLLAFCHPCQQEYRPEIGLQYACPVCQSPLEDILSGRELKINRVEFSQPTSV